MHLLGYGEDSWTYVALKNHLDEVLVKLEDSDNIHEIVVLYRPSFGRKKGIGEFDFIIMSATRVYFGESKMAMGKKKSHQIKLKKCQINRHDALHRIIKSWFLLPIEGQYLSNLSSIQIGFHMPSHTSTLYSNLNSFVSFLSSKYTSCPQLVNTLLVFSDQPIDRNATSSIDNFLIVNMIIRDLGEVMLQNYINML